MKLTGKENYRISLEEAKRFISGYKAEKAEFMTEEKREHKEAKKGGFFGKYAIIELLNQPGCIGMRYYYGRSDTGMKNLVLVGVNENGNDILPKPDKKQSEAILLEQSYPCPPFCSEILENDN